MRREDFNAGRGEEKGCGQALIEPLRTNKRANRDHDDLDARGVALVGHLLTRRVAERHEACKDEVASGSGLVGAHQLGLELVQKVLVGLLLLGNGLG